MDDSSFDRLARLISADASRRTLLETAGASALGALGLAALLGADEARAAKGGRKRRRRRCKKNVGATCNPPGKKCCRGLACQEGSCCKKLGTRCGDGSECCGEGICDNVTPNGKPVCCNIEGNSCSKDRDCCDELTCNEETKECVAAAP